MSANQSSQVSISDNLARAIVETLHEPLVVLSPDLTVQAASPAFFEHFEVGESETLGHRIYDLGNGQWNIASLRTLLEEILPRDSVFYDFEVEHAFESIGRRVMLLNARQLNHSQLILLGIRDITDANAADRALRASRQRLEGIYASAKVGISEMTADGGFVRVNDEMCRIMGRSREDILASDISELTHPDDLARCVDGMRVLFDSGEPFSVDKRYVRPDGSFVHANSTASLIEGSDPPTMVVVTIDLTERRQAEEAMRSSEARLHALVAATSDVVFRMSPDWTRMRRLEVGGFLEDATSDQPWLERYIPHDEQEEILEAIEHAKETGEVFELEHRALRNDGSVGWMHSRAVPVTDDKGAIVEWFGAATDITDRKEAEEATQRSEAQMRLMTDSLPVLISYVDADHRYGFINQTYERWFGKPIEELASKPVVEVIGRKAYDVILPRLKLALSGQLVSFEASIEYPVVGRRDVSAVYVPDTDASGNVRGMFAMITDVTDRKKAEEALRTSEEQYRALFNSIDEGFCVLEMIYDDDGIGVDYTFLEINPAFERHTGLTNAIGKRVSELVPDLESHWPRRYGRVGKSGEAERFVEQSEVMGRWFDVYAFPVGEPEQHRVALLFDNITDSRRAEEELRLSEQRYRLLVESAREYAMLMIDPDGTIVSWNAGAERLFGYTAQEMVGQPSEKLYTEEDRAAGAARRKRERALAEGQASTDQWYRRKDGTLFWANGVLRPLENGHPRGFIKILRDQTRQKAHEEQLKTVMAELNHRVKNTLAVVQSIASQTMQRASSLEAFRPDFEKRLRSIARAHSLLTRTSWTGVTLGKVIESEVGAAPGDVRVSQKGPDVTLPPEMTLALHMVLHELTTNARKYGCLGSHKGALSIEWKVEGAGDDCTLELGWHECCPTPIARPGADGFGSRLIEQLIVYELEGEIDRMYEPDGLRFRLRVPFTPVPPAPHAEQPADQAPEANAGTHEREPERDPAPQAERPRVLLVEDMAMLAMAMKDELEALGFTVIGPAPSVARARALVEQDTPAVAVLDVNLGDEQVYPLIPVLQDAGVPIVLLTGHDADSIPEAFVDIPVLPKPVELDDLERVLRGHAGVSSPGA